MELGVISASYVGLVTAVGLAELGHDVVCADEDPDRVARLRAGRSCVSEPDLADALGRGLSSGRLRFDTLAAEAIRGRDVVFVASPTTDAAARDDLAPLLRAVDQVRIHADRELVLVLSSAGPIGTHELVRLNLRGSGHPIHLVSQPETLPRGDALRAFHHERIVLGAHDRVSLRPLLSRVYAPRDGSEARMHWTDPASAELTRHLRNAGACRASEPVPRARAAGR